MNAAPVVHRADGCRLPVANVFPPEVRDSLVRASQTPVVNELDNARAVAINRAIERARIRYPHLFR